MAIDSAAKRYSAMNPMSPWRHLAVVPSGTIAIEDRAAVLFLYGISTAAPASQPDVTKIQVYVLPSISGLRRWVDYIPVQVVVPGAGKLGTYDDDGALAVEALASETGSVRWIDHIPVYAEGTKKWSFDDNGYLPVDTLTP